MAHRSGFVVPNAGDIRDGQPLINNRQAEPDAEDFGVLGNANYGVLTGFDFEISTIHQFQLNTSSAINVAVIDGQIYKTENLVANALTGSGGGGDRFDLVVYLPLATDASKLQIIHGQESGNPTFPDLPADALLVAAIIVPDRIVRDSLTMQHVIDKRVWMLNGARGAAEDGDTFLENRIFTSTTSTQTFKVYGNGITQIGSSSGASAVFWPVDGTVPQFNIIGGETTAGVRTEIVFDTPKVSFTTNVTVGGSLTAVGRVNGSNLLTGALTGTPPIDVGGVGSLYQDTQNGRVYVKRPDNQWAEIYADEYPPGTIISTLLNSAMAAEFLTGSWLECRGQIVEAADYPRLNYAFVDWRRANAKLQIPDLRDCFVGSSSLAAEAQGTIAGANKVNLTASQLAPHRHFPGNNGINSTLSAGSHDHHNTTDTGAAGGHTHGMPLSGQHEHQINDPGHVHIGADHGSLTGLGTFTYFIEQRWGGRYVLDMFPADAGHGTVVDITDRTMPALTGIQHTQSDGLHSHALTAAPAHTHPLDLSPDADHAHALPQENQVGTASDIDNRPRFMSVKWYVKA